MTNDKRDKAVAEIINSIRPMADTDRQVADTMRARDSVRPKKVDTLTLTGKSSIHILQMEKYSRDDSQSEYYDRCAKWRLDSNEVIRIMKNSEQMNSNIWHFAFSVLPCEMTGIVDIDNKKYNFRVNAGSYFKLYNNDTTYYFDADKKPLRKYFLEESDHGEN